MDHSVALHRARRAPVLIFRIARPRRAFRVPMTVMLAGTLLGIAWPAHWHFPENRRTAAPHARFGSCFTGGGFDCVVDGDTIWIGGAKVRVADIDAPETHPPRCPEEAKLGFAAADRLRALLNAGPVTLEPADRDRDRYGRLLRVVTRDGRSLGQQMVAEGLARPWEGHRRPWC